MSISIFVPPPLPESDQARERAVLASGILEARNDPVLNAICFQICGTLRMSASLLSALYGDTQYVTAAFGFATGAYRRRNSFSGHAIAAAADVFVVADLMADERFSENPWVNGEVTRFRAYVAALVRDSDRQPIAVISALANAPFPTFGDAERNAMLEAAGMIASRLVELGRGRHPPQQRLD